MKKLFTLLTLMLLSIGSAWAQSPTYKSDFTDGQIIWTTVDNVDDAVEAGWMVKGGKISSTKDLKGKKLLDPATNEVATSAQFSESTKFYVEKAYNSTASSDQSLYIYVTGVAKMYLYAWCNSSPDDRELVVTVNGEEKGKITFAKGGNNAQYTSVVLSKAANNIIRINGTNEVELTAIKAVTGINSVAFNGVKEDETTLAESTDYTISGTTITLDETHKKAVAPTDICLIQRTTFSDSSTNDEDIVVSFGSTPTAGYFVGTATINATTYTVKVPVDASPTLTLSETSGTATFKSYENPVKEFTTTLSGGNLTNGTYNVTCPSGITISPTSFAVVGGSVSQEFTISTSATTASGANEVVFTCGSLTRTFTLTFAQPSQGTDTEVTPVSAATTWDWAKAGNGVTEIKLTTGTNPTKNDEFILSNLPEINNNSDFNAAALKVKVEYPVRDNKYMQGGYIWFTNTVPGTIEVTFTNTGSSNEDRCLTVDGVAYNDVASGKGNSNGQVTKTVEIAAGNHVLSGAQVEDNAANYLRFYKVVFTPVTSVNATIGSCEWATFSSKYPVNVSGISGLKAYKVTGFSGSAITKEEVTGVVPANTGLLLNGVADTYEIPVAATAGSAIAGNKLMAVTEETTVSAGTGTNVNYVLVNNSGNAEFQWIGSTDATVPAGRAYLTLADGPKGTGARLFIDDTTGIGATFNDNVEMINDNVIYDLSGRRVENPTKGIYIINGKKVVIR